MVLPKTDSGIDVTGTGRSLTAKATWQAIWKTEPEGERKVEAAVRSWAVSEADHPVKAGAAEKPRLLLGYAILAPSGHNTQPWLFHMDSRVVEVRADRTRALPVVDPEDRDLPGELLERLVSDARDEGVRLHLACGDERVGIAELIAEGDRILLRGPSPPVGGARLLARSQARDAADHLRPAL